MHYFKLLLQSLLGPELTSVSTLLLTAVSSTRGQPCVALTADRLITVVSTSQKGKRGIVNSSTKAKNQVQSTLLLDVVVAQGAAILELLSSEDKTLLIRGDSLLILDLSLYIIDSVAWLNIKCNGLTSKSLYENLHCLSCNIFLARD